MAEACKRREMSGLIVHNRPESTLQLLRKEEIRGSLRRQKHSINNNDFDGGKREYDSEPKSARGCSGAVRFQVHVQI